MIDTIRSLIMAAALALVLVSCGDSAHADPPPRFSGAYGDVSLMCDLETHIQYIAVARNSNGLAITPRISGNGVDIVRC